MDNQLMQLLANVPGSIAETSGFVPKRPQSEDVDSLSYEALQNQLRNANIDARRGRTVAALGLGLTGGTLGPIIQAMRGSAAVAPSVMANVGSTFPMRHGAHAADEGAGDANALRNLLMQRMQRGQSLPPGLLDQ